MKIPKEIKYFKVQWNYITGDSVLVKLKNGEKIILQGKVTEEKLKDIVDHKNQLKILL